MLVVNLAFTKSVIISVLLMIIYKEISLRSYFVKVLSHSYNIVAISILFLRFSDFKNIYLMLKLWHYNATELG